MIHYILRSKIFLIILLLFSILVVEQVFAGTHLYFSGERSYGQIGISGYVSQLKGGQTQIPALLGYRAHNATQITPYHKIEAVGIGYVELHHGTQSNKRNHCWWTTSFGYTSGTLETTCHYYD